ncbi:conserved hypothetical protein [uncultured delta proteobacterium]|uniref:Uncharacterized protein n=1 Tax=uncultured delta proteobacterium TaxID=34034 RepID=A0A212JD74_9DELT|nr:conserved hypothetical protein [uncultured delta proteobacterium]
MKQLPPLRELITATLPSFEKICGDIQLPRMRKARQHFSPDSAGDVAAATRKALETSGCLASVKPGARIALCVGSRGLASLADLVAATVAAIRAAGGEPFIVPSMGSHGGATAEGQTELLAALGVTENTCGAPVVSSMETAVIGETRVMVNGTEVTFPMYLDKQALDADGIVPINRIKPHTAYRGAIESGLCKMLAIGLGKHEGAMSYHRYGFGIFPEVVPAVAKAIIEKTPVLFGVASIENAFHQVAEVEAIPAGSILEREPALLKRAFALMGRLYFDNLDVLIIDEVGKDHSGDGMDPNITGSFSTPYGGKGLEAATRLVLGVSEGSHGNFVGLGLADITTIHAFDQSDPLPTYTNCLTCRLLKQAKIPMVTPNEKIAFQAAVFHSILPTAGNPRMVRIRNTGDIAEIEISEALWAEAERHPQVTLAGEPFSYAFDGTGRLIR